MISTSTTPKRGSETLKLRKTPTQRQVETLQALNPETLIQRACDSLHCLNRRAKKMRDQASEISDYGHGRWRRGRSIQQASRAEMNAIYAAKSTLLVALLRSGRGALYRYSIEGREQTCLTCGRDWRGDDHCYQCGNNADVVSSQETWHIVEVCGHRFHQPPGSIPAELTGNAIEIEPHDPTQPQREVPSIGLTIAAQSECVRMAIEALATEATAA